MIGDPNLLHQLRNGTPGFIEDQLRHKFGLFKLALFLLIDQCRLPPVIPTQARREVSRLPPAQEVYNGRRVGILALQHLTI
jgi:hypothetical protein